MIITEGGRVGSVDRSEFDSEKAKKKKKEEDANVKLERWIFI